MIDKAFRAEWNNSEIDRALGEVFHRVGVAWTTLDVAKESKSATLVLARISCGPLPHRCMFILWDVDEWVVCPQCGDDFTRDCFYLVI